MMKRFLALICVGIFIFVNSGCATIMSGTRQKVDISSIPQGATVIVDDEGIGQTPLVAKLDKKNDHLIKINLAGYEPYQIKLKRGLNGWVWGNILIGGIFGLAIDYISGGVYKLSPAEVEVVLKREGMASLYHHNNRMYVAVVLNPDAGWQKIGQLERLKTEN